MMRKDNRMLLAGLLAAVAALALVGPASASAASWKEKGVTVTKDFSIGLAGAESFEFTSGTVGGMQCSVKMTMAQTSLVTKITAWSESSCSTTFGGMNGCAVSTAEPIGLPWTATVNTTNITVANMHIKRKFKTGCSRSEWNATITSTKFTPDNTTEIHEFETLGEISGSKTYGTVSVESPNSGKYGIG